MPLSERERLSAGIVALADLYGRDRTALLPILQAVRDRYHHISDFATQEIAHLLAIHPVEVHGVVTFYSFLRERRLGRYVIRLCRTISCDMQGKDRIARRPEAELGISFGETPPTDASRWSGPTAWECATRNRPCWSTTRSTRG